MRLHHVGIVVDNIKKSNEYMNNIFDYEKSEILTNLTQKVNYCFLGSSQTKIELIEPTSDDSPIANFLKNNGNGLHHIAFEVDDIETSITKLTSNGGKLISKPSIGFENRTIAFIFSHSSPVQLIELVSKKLVE